MTEEQRNRLEAFRRSAVPRPYVKKVHFVSFLVKSAIFSHLCALHEDHARDSWLCTVSRSPYRHVGHRQDVCGRNYRTGCVAIFSLIRAGRSDQHVAAIKVMVEKKENGPVRPRHLLEAMRYVFFFVWIYLFLSYLT
jgi:hypothetical protein